MRMCAERRTSVHALRTISAHTSSDSNGSIGSQPVHRIRSAASDRRQRAEQIADDVQGRRRDVHVVTAAATAASRTRPD